jgi:transposase
VLDTITSRPLARATFPTTAVGHQAALEWMREQGVLDSVGVESTGTYGAGLARHLAAAGVKVVEVNRPEKLARYLDGKDDFIDAEAAARAVLSGRASAIPKSGDGPVEAIRSLESAHESAAHDRVEAINQFKSMMFRAPNGFRDVFSTKTFQHQLNAAVRFGTSHDDLVEQELRVALKLLAQRIRFLESQIADIEARLRPIIAEHFPAVLGLHGVGPHSAAQLLLTAGDNADRLHSDAAFAKLCGACPQPASTGKSVRFRLDRGGYRKANRALYRIVIVRMRHDEATRHYVARRIEEGKTKAEIIRCLKRFVAREICAAIINPPDEIPTGAQLRDSRVATGVTLTELATALGITPTKLSRLERGLEHNTKTIRRALDLTT